MRTALTIFTLFISLLCANGQSNDFRQRYERFKQEAVNKHQGFRDQCNKAYADFLSRAWVSYNSIKVEKPREDMVPPVIFDNKKPREDKAVIVKDTVAPPPVTPRPEPIDNLVSPVSPEPQFETSFAFKFYGDSLKVRVSDEIGFHLRSTECKEVASIWNNMKGPGFDALLVDCLNLRESLSLCDWAYLQMLCVMTSAYYHSENEATLLTAWILCQSGYKIRVAKADKGLCFLFGSKYIIYGARHFKIGDDIFYCMGADADELEIADKCVFPGEKELSLDMKSVPVLGHTYSDSRVLKSERYSDASLTSSVNVELIEFYSSYPNAQYGDNFMTRWAMYANTPVDAHTREQVYPALRSAIAHKSQFESVNILLNFVQTAFEYEFDDKIWGSDRAFFSEETLYYKYCDCEDRSILFSKLVRDLLGLEVALVYYPNHLATAVRFEGDVNGDCLVTSHGRFTICDPTYIGAPVGATMDGMDNNSATIIYLRP